MGSATRFTTCRKKAVQDRSRGMGKQTNSDGVQYAHTTATAGGGGAWAQKGTQGPRGKTGTVCEQPSGHVPRTPSGRSWTPRHDTRLHPHKGPALQALLADRERKQGRQRKHGDERTGSTVNHCLLHQQNHPKTNNEYSRRSREVVRGGLSGQRTNHNAHTEHHTSLLYHGDSAGESTGGAGCS